MTLSADPIIKQQTETGYRKQVAPTKDRGFYIKWVRIPPEEECSGSLILTGYIGMFHSLKRAR